MGTPFDVDQPLLVLLHGADGQICLRLSQLSVPPRLGDQVQVQDAASALTGPAQIAEVLADDDLVSARVLWDEQVPTVGEGHS